MIGTLCRAGCENLVEGIIVQAAEDFRKNYRRVLENPHNSEARKRLESVTAFFLSDWYGMMTNVDGSYLVAVLRKEVSEEYQRKTAKKLKKTHKNTTKGAENVQIRSNE